MSLRVTLWTGDQSKDYVESSGMPRECQSMIDPIPDSVLPLLHAIVREEWHVSPEEWVEIFKFDQVNVIC